jgi:hypothetical protein
MDIYVPGKQHRNGLMCGFVVFVCSRHEGVDVPLLLPLGSFSWGLELVTERTKKRKREHPCMYRYSVRPKNRNVSPQRQNSKLSDPRDSKRACLLLQYHYKAVRVEGDSGGHVLRETTSRGLCGLVCPSRTSEGGGEGDCLKEGGVIRNPPNDQESRRLDNP